MKEEAYKPINIRETIEEKFPKLILNRPDWIVKLIVGSINKVLHVDQINDLLSRNHGKKGIELIDDLFDELNFSYQVSNSDLKKIPAEGRLILVANHPIGSLDGLSLYKLVYELRKDVKVVTTDILSQIQIFKDVFLGVDIETLSEQRKSIVQIGRALQNEEVVIIFPAAEVARLNFFRVRDSRWNKGSIFFAKKFNVPILPVYVHARNSWFFYLFSMINKGLSRVLLANEMYNKKNKTINLKIGDPIPTRAFSSDGINIKAKTHLLKKHVYSLKSGKGGFFATEKNIIHPVDSKIVHKELMKAKFLGKTGDDKLIILTSMEESPNVVQEIGRLRELTFRKVGEGTGKKVDLDKFDKYYKHIVVWDENELDIVGAYRLGVGKEIIKDYGFDGFYSSTLFKYREVFTRDYLPDSIELGRSFVQKKYWNTNALHYLWLGIGAYCAHNPETKYMFGPVSISNSYPEQSKNWIVAYCQKWFSTETEFASANRRFLIHEEEREKINKIFVGENHKQDYFTVKNMLKPMGFTFPVLYKHYSELCDENGVQFLDFGVDPDFENCIDGLILVDIAKIKDEKKERYITPFIPDTNKKENQYHSTTV